jgi:hypothetical protein
MIFCQWMELPLFVDFACSYVSTVMYNSVILHFILFQCRYMDVSVALTHGVYGC